MFQPTNAFGDPGAFLPLAIFFEEALEHLANVEGILLRMDIEAPHADDLNGIFRAVHSIKGSAAMLGYSDMAALTHLQENLLDLLRKGERPIGRRRHRGHAEGGRRAARAGAAPPRPAAGVAGCVRGCRGIARPRGAAGVRRCARPAGPGPVQRSFRVALGPLAAAIDASELEMMLGGLSDMGTVSNNELDNRAGGSVGFDVLLEGAAADLQSVLSLVVAPELITITTLVAPNHAPVTVEPAPQLHAVAPAEPAANEADELDEFFIDPAEFRRKASAATAAAMAAAGARNAQTMTAATIRSSCSSSRRS